MEFRIADTFTDSLAKLAAQDQKSVKTTAFDLQVNPASPGMRFHKLDRPRDPNFWSIRVSDDIRIVVHKTSESLLLCYAGHHDEAYAWAERRRIETHPKTGAAQLVEVRERVEEIIVRQPAAAVAPASTATPAPTPLFAHISDDDLLSYGVPVEWLDDVKKATEDSLFDVADHLPQEAAEALLDLATGTTPQVAVAAAKGVNPFSHPDAQRRFRVFDNIEELQQALEFPWEKWTVFLHPAQRHFVERNYNGPTRICGSAGTGKTIVALHRAVYLARTWPKARVLVSTFSKALANALKTRLHRLAGNQPGIVERITVRPITGIGYELYTDVFGQPNIAPDTLVRSLLEKASSEAEAHRFTRQFLYSEWADVFGRLAQHFKGVTERPFDYAVVDEAQDIGIAELRFLAALGSSRADSLFFTGDLGQRIFQQPFSWKALGVDVRGRSHTLRINYRTSHQIRTHADRLLPSSLADVDGNVESRRGTVSIFNGPPPGVVICETEQAEIATVAEWIRARVREGVQPHEIGVFVRDHPQRKRATAAAKAAGASGLELGETVETASGKVAIGTMHLAKGLEFRAVAVMACDDEVLPLQERIENVSDDSDLEEVYNTERHLLYVACTRARDHLLVTGVKPASEFLDDMIVQTNSQRP